MDISLISERYAKALLDYSEDLNLSAKVYEEMYSLGESFYTFREIRKAINSPFITSEQRDNLIIAAAGGDVSEPFKRFFDLVVKQHRLSCLHEMALKYCDLYRMKKNIHYCKLTTAVDVDDEELNKIRSTVSHLVGEDCIVEIKKQVDKDILGGFIFEIDSKLLNGSVSHQLQQIKNELVDKYQRLE